MNHIKVIPKVVKYGKRVPVAINNTIRKKPLTSVCESGILEGKIEDEPTSRNGSIGLRTYEDKDARTTETKSKREATDKPSGNNDSTEAINEIHTGRKRPENKSTTKSRKKRVRPSNPTSD